MRVRITQTLSGEIDGIDLSKYIEGLTYEVGTTLANYLLAQGWAQPAGTDAPATFLTFTSTIRRPEVLVVEDDDDMRTIVAELLEFHGWRTVVAADGVEGLQLLQKHRPSLILLDLALPRMDGTQFRAAQRRLPDRKLASVPCVIVSAVHDAPAYKPELHAADVLLKPFEADRLLRAVETHARPVFRL